MYTDFLHGGRHIDQFLCNQTQFAVFFKILATLNTAFHTLD